MWGMIAALLGSALVSAIGGAVSAKVSSDATKTANDTNIELANTAHQREVKDLLAAGLNPWLSVQGSGAGGQVVADTSSAKAVQASTSDIASSLQSLAFMSALQARQSNAKAVGQPSLESLADSFGVSKAELLKIAKTNIWR